MKRLTNMLLLLILSHFLMNEFALGQRHAGDYIGGIKVGANLARIEAEENLYGYETSKIGAAGGLYFLFRINGKVAFRPEIFYSMKGGRAENGKEDNSSGLAINLNYVDLPLLGVYSPVRDLKIFSGPYVSFFLNGETWEYYSDGEVIENTNYGVGRNQISSPDYGLVFGTQISLRKIPYLSIYHFDIRYSVGLSNNVQKNVDVDQNNRMIQILIGWGRGT